MRFNDTHVLGGNLQSGVTSEDQCKRNCFADVTCRCVSLYFIIKPNTYSQKISTFKRPALKIFTGKAPACLTYLGRSLKVSNFWNNFGPQGRFDEK